MSEEVAVSLQDIEFFCGGVLVLAAEGPGAGILRGVFGCEFKRANADS